MTPIFIRFRPTTIHKVITILRILMVPDVGQSNFFDFIEKGQGMEPVTTAIVAAVDGHSCTNVSGTLNGLIRRSYLSLILSAKENNE